MVSLDMVKCGEFLAQQTFSRLDAAAALVSFGVSTAVTFRCILVRGHNVFEVKLWFGTLIHIEY